MDKYKAALKEEVETCVRVKQGVLTLYAVSDKVKSSNITVFEIYADANTYKSHTETAHYKKYKSVTIRIVLSLELEDKNAIALEAKK